MHCQRHLSADMAAPRTRYRCQDSLLGGTGGSAGFEFCSARTRRTDVRELMGYFRLVFCLVCSQFKGTFEELSPAL